MIEKKKLESTLDFNGLVKGMKRDGTMETFNGAMKILSEHKEDLTPVQLASVVELAKCLRCDRVYCDHPRN